MNNLFPVSKSAPPPEKIQGRLMALAALFLFVFSLILTFSPAARAHSWQAGLRWSHWIGFVIWLGVFSTAHQVINRKLPEHDPYILPIISLLSGWGTLTIWRLSTVYGIRQAAWLVVCLGALAAALRNPTGFIDLLRRYKYLWLTTGLTLAFLTFFFGTYPGGEGPRLWLGCCGIYLQPSEPLKLLLVAYLAAYLADQFMMRSRLTTLLFPTLLLSGFALAILVGQRDLGTSLLFLVIYTGVIFVTSGKGRVLWVSAGTMALAIGLGYLLFDVIRLRVDAWLNPWLDPSGRSFQIVQSLIAVAAGGLEGRGIGLGNPSLVPIAHSDFIFAAIAEETGLLGALGMILLFALLCYRGMLAALHAADTYRRYLAAGLTIYLGAQAILIIGGNLRFLPLTGVTLPFVSYGGSSLLTAFISAVLILLVSYQPESEPAVLLHSEPYLVVMGGLLVGFIGLSLMTGWWAVVREGSLLTRNDNLRRAISDRYVKRGDILDRNGNPLSITEGNPGNYTRYTIYPTLSHVLGYTHSAFGQAGLEDSLDAYLRGTQGNPSSLIEWNYLLYGQPPPGLDVRLSIDLDAQRLADEKLADATGALVLMNAKTGEILAMASHPYYNPNNLDTTWPTLTSDPNAPLLNRAAQAQYPMGTALGPYLLSVVNPNRISDRLGDYPPAIHDPSQECSLEPSGKPTWEEAIAKGCVNAILELRRQLGNQGLYQLFNGLGFYTAPAIPLPVAAPVVPVQSESLEPSSSSLDSLTISPLQMGIAAAALTDTGMRANPRLVLSYLTPVQGWVVAPAKGEELQIIPSSEAERAITGLEAGGLPIWQAVGRAQNGPGKVVTWYIGGYLPAWQGPPVALALLLEQDNPALAQQIGQAVLLGSK